MKTKSFLLITAGIALFTQAPAVAIEAPADDAPPPPPVESPPALNAPAAEPAKPEIKLETAYLGVVAAEVPQMLAEHLGIKPGEGIVVQAVMPEGPAAKAGIAIHDVITRVGDQAVGSSLDLTQQVTGHKPGDTVHLELIRKGKPMGADVILGVRPADVAAIAPQPLDQLNLDGIPKDLADRIRGMIQGNIGGMEMQLGADGGLQAAPQMEEAMREMKKRMEMALGGINAPELQAERGIETAQGATIRIMDEQGSIELKSSDGSKEVTIRDKDNQITWTGPWDTEQDKAAAPEDVRQRVDRIKLDSAFKGNGLRLRMGGAGGLNDGGE